MIRPVTITKKQKIRAHVTLKKSKNINNIQLTTATPRSPSQQQMKNQNIHYYDSTRFNSQQQPDGASFISLLLCSFGMFTKNKLVIWLAVFFILSTFCRKKYSASSMQYLINGVMIVFGLVTSYVMQPPGF